MSLCLKVIGTNLVPLIYLLLKSLSGAATGTDRRVAYHQDYNYFVVHLIIIKKIYHGSKFDFHVSQSDEYNLNYNQYLGII